MSTPTVCPYCQARLRMRDATAPRVKCRTCGKGFANPLTPTVASDMLTRPLFPAAGDAPRPAAAPSPVAVETVADPEPDAAPPPQPPATFGFTPDAMLATPRPPRRHRAAAARRLRQRYGRRLRPLDYLVAVAVGIVLIGVLALGVRYLVRTEAERTGSELADGPTGPEPTPDPALRDGPIQPLAGAPDPTRPLPPELIGVWELRADEDRSGSMDLRADGTTVVLATRHGQEVPPTHCRWGLVAADGPVLTLEFGAELGVLGNYRIVLRQTGPDAFTIERTISQGIEEFDAQRFVRRATPYSTPP